MKNIITFLTLGLFTVTANATVVTYDFNTGMEDSTSGGDLTASLISYTVGTQTDGSPEAAERTWADNKVSGDYSLYLGQRGLGNSGVDDVNLTTTAAATLQFTLIPNAGQALDFSMAELSFDQSAYIDSGDVNYAYKIWADTGGGFVAVGALQTMGNLRYTFGAGSDLFELDEITDYAPSRLTSGTVQSQDTAFIFDLSSLGALADDQAVTFAIAVSSNRNYHLTFGSTLDNLVIDLAPIHGYDGWAASFGLIGTQTDDDDGDGLSNIYEFGAGGNPTNSADVGYSPSLGMIKDTGTNWMHYTHVRRINPVRSLSYVLEENLDLMSGSWTTANSVEVTSTILPADPDFERVTHRISATEPSKFIRLKTLIYVAPVYSITSPEDLDDGIAVGTLDVPGTDAAVAAFIADDEADKYENLDSLLIYKDGKLVFERYNRDGAIDEPHYMMSITKTMTSVVLARAIQMGYLNMDDLDKPVIDFMPALNRTTLVSGVETITVRDALFMKSGIRLPAGFQNGRSTVKQAYWQEIFENTEPITPASKLYQYKGINPEMILMILDIKTGNVAGFIQTELGDKMGADYSWPNSHGTPQGGAGSYFTSRFLMKVGVAVLNGGMHAGEQWLSPDYVDLIMDTNKGEGYFYYFHNRKKFGFPDVNFISGIGAGGQYMSIYPNDNMVVVATSTDVTELTSPLIALEDHFVDLLMER